MNKKNPSIENCLETLQIEIRLIKNSASLTGFINRIIFKFMPLLRTHPVITKGVEEWEEELLDESLRHIAYSELNEGYCLIHEKAKTSREYGIVEVLENILSRVTNGGNYYQVKDPPYQRVYPHFRAYHMNLVSRDAVFAPAVLRLKNIDSYSYQVTESDTNPAYLWSFLLSLEKAWMMNQDDLSITWEPTNKKGIELWVDSDSKWRHARLSYLSGNLKAADTPNYKKDFFNRPFCEQILDRLLDELALPKEEGTVRSRDDIKINEFIKAYWGQNPKAKHAKLLHVLNDKISKKPDWLERKVPYKDSTFLTKIRKCDPREHKTRGRSLKTS